MKLNYESENFENWSSFELVTFRRKLVYETAFDGIVKIYFIKSNDAGINKMLENKFFGDFIHYSNCGIFLRMFETKTSWPNTILVYIDFAENYFVEIKKTSSSWNIWEGTDLGYGKHSIKISPTEKIEFQIGSRKN